MELVAAAFLVPPRVKAMVGAIEMIDDPAALPFRDVALEDGIGHAVLGHFFARYVRHGRFPCARRREANVDDRLQQADHDRLRHGEDDHRAERERRPRFVALEVAVEPAQKLHR